MKRYKWPLFAISLFLVAVIGLFIILQCRDGLKKCDARPELVKDIKTLTSNVNITNLENTVKELERFGERYSPAKQLETAEYLIKKLQDVGLEVEYQTYDADVRRWGGLHRFRNVIVKFTGLKYPEQYYVIGAHYDSKIGEGETSAPGANDNGTGVAVLVEMARIFRRTKLESSLLIVFFSNEEQGHLGSEAFVKNYIMSKNMKVKGAIIVDMVGVERDEGDVDIATRPKYRWLADCVEKSIQLYGEPRVKRTVDKQCA